MTMCFPLSKIKVFWIFNTTILIFSVYTSVLLFLNYCYPYKNNLVHPYEIHKFKYILLWPSKRDYRYFVTPNTGEGRRTFIQKKCRFQNCFITSNRHLLKDVTLYDVIVFHGRQVIHLNDLPKHRSPRQKYVFMSSESSHYYPVCDDQFNGYFNWTWTYKIKSDVFLEPYIVRDKNGDVIGPKQVMHWLDIKEMLNVTNDIIDKLKTKTKCAAWIVSNCRAKSKRDKFVQELQRELNKFGLKIDVYGRCGRLKYSGNTMESELLRNNYYFYLAFENSFSEDYVTEKLLRALRNYAIPVVYGGANYSRFLPDGTYLNARELGPRKLAEAMNIIIRDREKYYSYFKWHNHYSCHCSCESPDTDDFCKICEMLNDKQLMEKETVYHDFKSWWNPAEIPDICDRLSLRAFLRKFLF